MITYFAPMFHFSQYLPVLCNKYCRILEHIEKIGRLVRNAFVPAAVQGLRVTVLEILKNLPSNFCVRTRFLVILL